MATGKTQDKVKTLLGDLGKPTLRGVRKCPKCGTYNGTRGISCKNKLCDVVFKEKEKKKGHSAEAVKIITGSTLQVFSVRLRDRGPDYRGFVQLPLVQDLDGNPAEVVDPQVLAPAARCYVENCARNSQLACPHVNAAIECIKDAQPLSLKNSVLNSLQASNDIKQAIWLLATETTGPLVQRVSKSVMVVKCKPNLKQPLGFLHFAFYETGKGRGQQLGHKFHCSCKSSKQRNGSGEDSKRCVHFYACLCAFSSDEKLMEEFAPYLDLDINATEAVTSIIEEIPSSPERQLMAVYQSMGDTEMQEANAENSTYEVVVAAEEFLETPSKKKRKEELVQASSALLTLQEANVKTVKVSTPAKTPVLKNQPTSVKKTIVSPNQTIDEGEVVSTFHSWLASVTERINQTMHYQFDGNPDPLVFHAPECFFDCLRQRISSGNRKKRLPNFTTAFVRKDALPLGTFTKYTWHITNIIHVKQIFDTQEMPLEITRNFVENRDSTYDLYEVPKVEAELNKNQTPIRPSELKTFLKVGNTSPDQTDPTPFIIEWIPDILPKSHIGELRIKFEYGHHRNGYLEERNSVSVEHPAVELGHDQMAFPVLSS